MQAIARGAAAGRGGAEGLPCRFGGGAEHAIAVFMILFPTDLASFLELIRQHGDAAYSFIFAFATSHGLLMGLFAGYAASSGVFSLGPAIVVCWLGSFAATCPLLDRPALWVLSVRALSAARTRRAGRGAARGPAPRPDDPVPPLSARPPWRRGLRLRHVALSWPTFLVLNFFAAGVWACAVVSAGFAFGRLSEKAMNDASQGFGIVMLVVFLGFSWMLSRRLERAVERSSGDMVRRRHRTAGARRDHPHAAAGPGNRVSRQMAEEIAAALENARQSAEVGACVLTGHGDVFCLGGDYQGAGPTDAGRHAFARAFIDMAQAMARIGKPLIAAVNGNAHAGGFSLVSPVTWRSWPRMRRSACRRWRKVCSRSWRSRS